MSLWGTLGYAFSRSSHTTERSFFELLASFIKCVIAAVCSKHPEIPATPPFWTLVSMYLFWRRNLFILLAMMAQNIFPSMSSSEISRNWSNVFELISLGIKHPSALDHLFGGSFAFQMSLSNFHSRFSNLGQCLSTAYDVPEGPEADAVLALLTVSCTR